MRKLLQTFINHAFLFASAIVLAGCGSTAINTPTSNRASALGKTVCDSYIIMSMCVRDLIGDGTVDMVYFTDTREAFMYQEGRDSEVEKVMPFHRCAVPLGADMQATTNRILNRENLSFTEELAITRDLIASYSAAKPTIDACNARFDDSAPVDEIRDDEFSKFEPDWSID